jgi:flagellar protein FlaJ
LLSLKKINQSDYEKKQSGKIEKELPFFITIIALLATSGFGPYTLLQKVKYITLLPIIQAETVKILKRIDMLGIDPLTALNDSKDRPSSKALGEFLSGYVSAIQSGGNVINFLKSKMQRAFERFENVEKQTVETVNGIVHAWLSIQIVVLAIFILVAAVGSNPIGGSTGDTPSQPPYMFLIFAPIMSVVFMIIVKNMVRSNSHEINIKTILKIGAPSLGIAGVLILGNIFSSMHIEPYILGISLIALSLLPGMKFRTLYRLSLDAEAAVPQILRDITEARKAGIGPEKCIVRACKRKDFKSFNKIANSLSSRLEWGV